MHTTLKHITQAPTQAHKKGGEKKGECCIVQITYKKLILLYYLCVGSNESMSLGDSHKALKSYIND